MFTMSQITQVFKYEEVDFIPLIETSLPAMKAGNYLWDSKYDTDESKIAFYLNNIKRHFANPNIFAFKRTVNGTDVSFNIGTRNRDNELVYIHALVNSLDGSKSWIYDSCITPQQTQFLINNGFKGMVISSFGNSAALQHQLKKYQSIEGIVITENWQLLDAQKLLLTKIEFPIQAYFE